MKRERRAIRVVAEAAAFLLAAKLTTNLGPPQLTAADDTKAAEAVARTQD